MSHRDEQYVGPYRLEKTLGKGQTGLTNLVLVLDLENLVSVHQLSKYL